MLDVARTVSARIVCTHIQIYAALHTILGTGGFAYARRIFARVHSRIYLCVCTWWALDCERTFICCVLRACVLGGLHRGRAAYIKYVHCTVITQGTMCMPLLSVSSVFGWKVGGVWGWEWGWTVWRWWSVRRTEYANCILHITKQNTHAQLCAMRIENTTRTMFLACVFRAPRHHPRTSLLYKVGIYTHLHIYYTYIIHNQVHLYIYFDCISYRLQHGPWAMFTNIVYARFCLRINVAKLNGSKCIFATMVHHKMNITLSVWIRSVGHDRRIKNWFKSQPDLTAIRCDFWVHL